VAIQEVLPCWLSRMFHTPKARALRHAKTLIQKTPHEKQQEYTKVLDMRDKIVKNIYGNKEEQVVRVPVAFHYIISNIIGQQSINSNSLVDITPLEAFELIEEGFAQLEKIYFANPNLLFKVLYYYYLSPRDLLFNKRFNRKKYSS
jgi:DNA-directed RNA polymerase II subunit RPB1